MRVHIGSLNLCSLDDRLETFTMQQESVLRHITAMLPTQLRATWEGQGRTREVKARRALSEFIEDTLSHNALDGPRGRRLLNEPEEVEAIRNAATKILGVIDDMVVTAIVDVRAVSLLKGPLTIVFQDTRARFRSYLQRRADYQICGRTRH